MFRKIQKFAEKLQKMHVNKLFVFLHVLIFLLFTTQGIYPLRRGGDALLFSMLVRNPRGKATNAHSSVLLEGEVTR